MTLKELALGVALATGLNAYAAVPDVRSYIDALDRGKAKEHSLEYSLLNMSGIEVCRIRETYDEESYLTDLYDFDCDGTFEVYASVKMVGGSGSEMEYLVRNPGTEEFFKEMDALCNNDGTTRKTFNMMRKKLEEEKAKKKGDE